MDLKSFISLFINHSFISCSLSGIISFPTSFDLRSLIDSYVEKNRGTLPSSLCSTRTMRVWVCDLMNQQQQQRTTLLYRGL